MQRPASVDRQTFLANVRRSGLLREEQLEAISPQIPETNRGRVVARIASLGSGAKLAAGSTNVTGISTGRDVSWQHDIEHEVIAIPPISCSQVIPAEWFSEDFCSGVGWFCLP